LDNTADLEALVKKSKCFLLFLTKGVFASFWVMQEIRAAVSTNIPIILLRETDDRHGAATEDELIAQCPIDLRGLLFGVGVGKGKKKTALAAPIIEWHRAKEFQVMIMLCAVHDQQIVLIITNEYGTGFI